ncbi:hypothetical protein [Desulforamulus ruminis]|uniref:hypothetical protein n=1 Tax=Desulforamulus ruminis TaxID=1564 RepID=UPI0023544195|nr:hypothetical protein [Desulforamulus ruminis]
MIDFMTYLDDSYGDQKREIAYRTRYVYEALKNEEVSLKSKWTIQDILNIEKYRQALSVQKRTALHHFVQYLLVRYNLQTDIEEFRILEVIEDIPKDFQDITKKYLEFLRSYRKLKHWTRFQLAYSLKYFFSHIDNNYDIIDVRQVTKDHILNYIHYLLSNNSQRNTYTRFRELSSFFNWTKRFKLTFNNPCKGIEVDYGHKITQCLDEEKQRELVKRWFSDQANLQEAVIGILGLIYGCSSEEIRNIKLGNFKEKELVLPGRPIPIKLPEKVLQLINRYLLWRDEICKGANNDYFLVSKISYKKNCPVSDNTFRNLLKETGLSPRDLRSTRIQDIAFTGNLKLLEGLGLSHEGMKPYIRLAAPVLLMEHNDE